MTGLIVFGCIMILAAGNAHAAQWTQNEKGWWYDEGNNSYPSACWRWIDGNQDGIAECYRFDESGYLYVNTVIDDCQVNEHGAWVIDQTIQTISSEDMPGRNLELGNTLSFSGNTVKTGWIKEGDTWRYKEKGEFVADSWKKIKGKTYYFDYNGHMVTGFNNIDGGYYCFDSSGAMYTSTFKDNGVYYVIEDESGIIVDEVNELDWEGSRISTWYSSDDDEYDYNDTYSDDEHTDVTESEAYKKITALKDSYPEGMHWDNSNSYQSGYRTGYGCAGFAFLAQDTAFGSGSPQVYDDLDWDRLKVGDHIRVYNNAGGEHSVIILKKTDDNIIIAEGNYNSSIHWGRKISKESLEENFIYQETRY